MHSETGIDAAGASVVSVALDMAGRKLGSGGQERSDPGGVSGLATELGFEMTTTDVDAAAAAGDAALRAEYGDRLPVVLLDGREHSYWEVDEARLRSDLSG